MPPPLDTPIVLILFNRPDQTRQVFHAIAKVRPRKLLVIADGPRATHPGDQSLCARARSVLADVDWPCEVLTNFSDHNLGCGERVASGLNWAFSLVQEAIILEDDCLPHVDFFRFCEEMLERYRGDSRIGCISGTNLDPHNRRTSYSYYYSQLGACWGWATWRDAWQKYDPQMRNWRDVRASEVLAQLWRSPATLQYWTSVFDGMHDGTGPDTWDHQWTYTRLINNMLSIVPSVNMVRNIGFGPEATHTFTVPKWTEGLKESSLQFPLKHPPYVIPMRSFDDLDQRICYPPPTTAGRLIRKARRVGGRVKRSLRGVKLL